MKIIECIPNFSEGRDRKIVTSIADAASAVEGVKVLDYSMDGDHNRSVVTFMGTQKAVLKGAIAACSRAAEMIDMRKHKGIHPRIGAIDVVPFVPLGSSTMKDAVDTAHRFGCTFAERYDLPLYFYGEAAIIPDRKKLANIRKGGYEGLADKISNPAWQPDAGPTRFNPILGATAVGARNPLIAFNVNLKSDNIEIAKNIAKAIRYSDGGLPKVQALGLFLESRNIVQVSMNLTDHETTSIGKAFDAVMAKAREYGVEILESELIGLIPQKAFDGVTAEYLQLSDFSEIKIIENNY